VRVLIIGKKNKRGRVRRKEAPEREKTKENRQKDRRQNRKGMIRLGKEKIKKVFE